MEKTFITTMPDHIGAFLKASECLASLGINITRVSYNKAVDSHTLFIDARGSEEQLAEADKRLAKIGYLQTDKNDKRIVLIEFELKDVPGSVTDVLKLINTFSFNISYISSQENGTDYQLFKMGLFVEDTKKITDFINETEKLCKVKVIEYNRCEKVYDNSIFYTSFVNGLAKSLNLDERVKEELLVNANLAMQTLDECGLSPYKTFDSISCFADMLAKYRGEAFLPRITGYYISNDTKIILIEPPCGSNTVIIESCGEFLFIDCGYAIYRNEMKKIYEKLVPGFENINKRIFVTHADVDHCGLLSMFDTVFASKNTAECLRLESLRENGFREQNPLHKPYIKMCKILTEYSPVNPEKLKGIWERTNDDSLLANVGTFDFGELHFEVYEGKGGHLAGETVLIEYTKGIVFSGDIYINMQGLTAEQAEYNRYAPILMTSVDTDPALCAAERKALIRLLTKGSWQIFGSHGGKKDIIV